MTVSQQEKATTSFPRILVFDSGIGGISVLHAIARQLPEASFSYCADTEFWPYGDKSSDAIQQRLSEVLTAIDLEQHFDIAVIACNTASTSAIAHLRQQFSCLFVGVVPAIKPAAKLSQTKHIALLATENTVQGDYIEQLSKEFASDCIITKFALPELVDISETWYLSDCNNTQSQQLMLLDQLTSKLKSHPLAEEIDTVVLGCTHFPLMQSQLAERWPKPNFWIDSADAIAQRVRHLATGLSAKPQIQESKAILFTTSALTKKQSAWLQALDFANISEYQQLKLKGKTTSSY